MGEGRCESYFLSFDFVFTNAKHSGRCRWHCEIERRERARGGLHQHHLRGSTWPSGDCLNASQRVNLNISKPGLPAEHMAGFEFSVQPFLMTLGQMCLTPSD